MKNPNGNRQRPHRPSLEAPLPNPKRVPTNYPMMSSAASRTSSTWSLVVEAVLADSSTCSRVRGEAASVPFWVGVVLLLAQVGLLVLVGLCLLAREALLRLLVPLVALGALLLLEAWDLWLRSPGRLRSPSPRRK